MGMSGAFVRHIPLGLLYASIDSVKSGFDVDIVDVRLNPKGWREEVSSKISPDTLIAGLSVMTGAPIRSALEISRWVRERYPHVRVVWGGPHATFNGREILREPSVDFVISGYGSLALSRLATHLRGDFGAPELSDIPGLLYRSDGEIKAVPPEDKFEVVAYKDIPYHLIESDLDCYGQLDRHQRIFPMYSSLGCPYRCAFCSSPAQYKSIRKKYVCIPPEDVIAHIEVVKKRYNADYIYFIDDDSFVDLSHTEKIIAEIDRKKLNLHLGFRGARVDEIKKMDDAYLANLARAGTDIMHIGAESGSQRMLGLMQKDFRVEDIVQANRKLSHHKGITAAYNFIVGLPGETVADLKQTRELMMKLVSENPSAIIFAPNKYRPLPGTELYKQAVEYGWLSPLRPEDSADIEVDGDFRPPWYSQKMANLINMMIVTSFFIDNKIFKITTGRTWKFLLARLTAVLYTPIAKLRFKYGVSFGLVEHRLFRKLAASFRE